MKNLSTFEEFASSANKTSNESMYTEKSCMSEATTKKLQEMVAEMCNEMKACHEDETENTAESYMKACEGAMSEMKEKLSAACNEYMK